MISYVTVFEDEGQYYKNVAPKSNLLNLSASGHYMIGAVEDDGNSVGAIGFEIRQEIYEESPYICIDWLYIDEDYRGQGHGKALIKEVINVSDESGITDLRAEIPYPDTYDDITHFFQENGFDFMFTDSYEFRAYLGELSKSPYVGADVEKVKVVPLSKVPLAVYNDGIKKLAYSQLGEKADRISLAKNEYDQDISMAYVEDGQLMGIYLAQIMPDGTIESGNLFCHKKNIGIVSYNIVTNFVKAAVKKCSKDTVFHIKCQRTASHRLMGFLLPNWIGEIVRNGSYER